MPKKDESAGKTKYAAFGKLLKHYRELHSINIEPTWSQGRLADAIGVSRRTYSKWEGGYKPPDPAYLKKIVEVLGLHEAEKKALYEAVSQTPEAINMLPFAPNPYFTGREAYLARIKEMLQTHRILAVGGLGGIGKTQLVVEYAHACYSDGTYGAVLWVNATDAISLHTTYTSLPEALSLPPKDYGHDACIQVVNHWLREHTEWLLIIDNADDLDLLYPYMPTHHTGHILLTTRSQIVGTIAPYLGLEAMGLEEGILFLLRRSRILQLAEAVDSVEPPIRENAAYLVGSVLAGHTLAIDQAAAYMMETGKSITDYISLLGQERQYLWDRRGTFASQHPEALLATIQLSITKAIEQCSLVEDILFFCSFLIESFIMLDILHKDAAFMRDIRLFDEGLVAIQRYSLLKMSIRENMFIMHPIIRVFASNMVLRDPIKMKHFRNRVIRAMVAAYPPTSAAWEEISTSHIFLCTYYVTPEEEELYTSFPSRTGIALYKTFPGSDATREIFLLSRVILIFEQEFGLNDPHTGYFLSQLGFCYGGTNMDLTRLYIPDDGENIDLLVPILSRAVAIRREFLGLAHRDVVLEATVLAAGHVAQGKYDAAESLLRELLVAEEEHGNAKTSETLYQLGYLMERQERFDEADELHQRYLETKEREATKNDPA